MNGAGRSEFGFRLSARWCALSLLFILCGYLLAGCAARNTTSTRSDPPVADRSGRSAEREDTGGNNHDVSEKDATVSSVIANPSKRTNDSSVPLSTARILEGNASWYGIPFHGRRASNGEVYDMHKLTAAHRTLPFDTVVRVTNLTNGKSTVVRITDRGPFVENRIIDLSMAAAREIDSIGPGVVPVRLEIVSGGNPGSGFFTVQVGAFRDRNNAERLRARLGPSYPVFIQQYDSPEGLFYRVRVGKVPGEDAAREFGDQLRDREGFTPFVVRLDERTLAGENP